MILAGEIAALINLVATESHARICLQCSSYHTDSALWPVIEHLRRAAGLAAAALPGDQLDKLEALVRQGSGDIAAAAPPLAELLGLQAEARAPRD
jgi:hypothetical protein